MSTKPTNSDGSGATAKIAFYEPCGVSLKVNSHFKQYDSPVRHFTGTNSIEQFLDGIKKIYQ